MKKIEKSNNIGRKFNQGKKTLYYDNETKEPFSGHCKIYMKKGGDLIKVEEGIVRNGTEKDGKWTEWDHNGLKCRETNYKDGKLHGQHTYWVSGGILRRETFKNGILHGKYIENIQLYVDKVIKYNEYNYKDGKIDGKWIGYDGDRVSSETPFKNGERNGLRTSWFRNGKKMTEMYYKDDKLDGNLREWYRNGKIHKEETYKGGKKIGKHIVWYENGKKGKECCYKNGVKDGLRTYWFENGKKESVEYFKDGHSNGNYTVWYENGQVCNEGITKDGVQIEYTVYEEDGSIIVSSK